MYIKTRSPHSNNYSSYASIFLKVGIQFLMTVITWTSIRYTTRKYKPNEYCFVGNFYIIYNIYVIREY